ncbi:MAG: hypothetical protein ACOYWZ_13365 [Bacillota bacterium]
MATATALEYLEETPNPAVKSFYVTIATGAASGDTFTVDLGSYGIAEDGLLAVDSWTHSTSGSVVTSNEYFSTSVSSGTLTITIAEGNAGYKVFRIVGKATIGDFA